MNELKCPICGEPTSCYVGNNKRIYRNDKLCKTHAKMAKEGEISQCPDCGKWIFKGKICDCKQQIVAPNRDNDELTCIICGEPSNGKHFCFQCWNKYKNKSIDLRITNCNTTQVLDEYGNKAKKANNGVWCRSLSEKIILDYLFDKNIRVIYEKSIPYINEKGEEKELHPDFYLKDYDLYIEFNGLTNKSYLKMKNYVNKIYEEKGLRVEVLESDDINDIEKTMERLLSKYSKQ